MSTEREALSMARLWRDAARMHRGIGDNATAEVCEATAREHDARAEQARLDAELDRIEEPDTAPEINHALDQQADELHKSWRGDY